MRSFESRLQKLWKESEVMHNPDCYLKLLTSPRSLKYINACAQPVNTDDTACDLMSEV